MHYKAIIPLKRIQKWLTSILDSTRSVQSTEIQITTDLTTYLFLKPPQRHITSRLLPATKESVNFSYEQQSIVRRKSADTINTSLPKLSKMYPWCLCNKWRLILVLARQLFLMQSGSLFTVNYLPKSERSLLQMTTIMWKLQQSWNWRQKLINNSFLFLLLVSIKSTFFDFN